MFEHTAGGYTKQDAGCTAIHKRHEGLGVEYIISTCNGNGSYPGESMLAHGVFQLRLVDDHNIHISAREEQTSGGLRLGPILTANTPGFRKHV